MSAIEVAGLTMRYGDVQAVRQLSFTAEAGQVTCVLGRNGAGKTSTIEALEGLRRPTAGRLSVVGFDPQRDRAALAYRIGVMLQDVGIAPAARVGELMRCTAHLYPAAVDVGELLDRMGLAGLERRTFRQLSGGEQRRLAMALALVGRPQVAFLDEPTAGVDPSGRQVIRQVVTDLRAEGVAVLLTTHDLDEAERIADRVVIIHGGRLLAQGTIDEITTQDGDGTEVRFRAPPGVDTLALSSYLGGWDVTPVTEVAWGEYRVAATPTPDLIYAITSWLDYYNLPLDDVRTGRQSLEEVFLQLTATEDGRPELLSVGESPDRLQLFFEDQWELGP
jgi:ABC-2 type transport system ATP-binding protein